MLGNDGNDNAVHRCQDAGVAQIDLLLVHLNLRLHNTCIQRNQFGAGSGKRGLGRFKILARAGFVFQHAFLAFKTGLRLLQQRLFGL
ncbi:hypothetical protein D3C76_1323700 [compost metagenome]